MSSFSFDSLSISFLTSVSKIVTSLLYNHNEREREREGEREREREREVIKPYLQKL